jgi:hypothetical protein
MGGACWIKKCQMVAQVSLVLTVQRYQPLRH